MHAAEPVNVEDSAAVGRRIRTIRQAQQLTEDELAQRAGMSRSRISNIERGVNALSASAAMQIARALHVSVGVLLGETPQREHPAVYIDAVPQIVVVCDEHGQLDTFSTKAAARVAQRAHLAEHEKGTR